MKNILNEVMTSTEVAMEFHLERSVVAKACKRGWMPEGTFRKAENNGGYIILRDAAEKRWGKPKN